jgi:hypothetical protein
LSNKTVALAAVFLSTEQQATGQMTNIQFPALFCYSGADEMLRLDNRAALQSLLADTHAMLPDADYIIDSSGTEWLFNHEGVPYPTTRRWSLPQLIVRVQQHFFAQAQSCVSKIQAADLPSLILMVDNDEEL